MIKFIFNKPVLLLIRFYKTCISPFTPASCRFEPTCSTYAQECFQRFGFLKALHLTTKRILKCHPFHDGGYDPAPGGVSQEGNSK